jgi:hypothetical protein
MANYWIHFHRFCLCLSLSLFPVFFLAFIDGFSVSVYLLKWKDQLAICLDVAASSLHQYVSGVVHGSALSGVCW